MTAIQHRITEPANLEEAQDVVAFVIRNLGENYGIVRDSLRDWSAQGCHLLAYALKGSHYYSHGHNLGAALRTLTNTAIILEHCKATQVRARS